MSRMRSGSVAAGAFLLALVGTIAILPGDGAAQGQRPRGGPLRMDKGGNPYPETAAGFDCRRAASRVERLICTNRTLALMDGAMADIYRLLVRRGSAAERAALQRDQRQWLVRRNACANVACLEALYERRLAAMQAVRAGRNRALRARMSRVGQCELTRVDWVGARLQQVEGDRPQGTGIGFANGVDQFSYRRERPVLRSRPGDRARVCLADIPRNCPRGDFRGRIYDVTNLRTRARWRLADSSHSCGGA